MNTKINAIEKILLEIEQNFLEVKKLVMKVPKSIFLESLEIVNGSKGLNINILNEQKFPVVCMTPNLYDEHT